MGTTAALALRWPDLAVIARGPQASQQLAEDVETAYQDGSFSSYTPAWTAQGTVQPASPSLLTGRYKVRNGLCDFMIFCGFGASTTGGRDSLRFGLPVAASAVIPWQVSLAKMWVPNTGNFHGCGEIAAGTTEVRPIFPATTGVVWMDYWRHANSSGTATNQGIPQISAGTGLTIQSGGNIVITGRYLV